jgi:hypothetical protein
MRSSRGRRTLIGAIWSDRRSDISDGNQAPLPPPPSAQGGHGGPAARLLNERLERLTAVISRRIAAGERVLLNAPVYKEAGVDPA